MVNPVLFDTEHAFGYLMPDRFPEEDQEWVYLHNFCNGLSIPLSPLAGLIRLFVSLYFLYQCKYHYRPGLDRDRLENFCKAQAIRSGAEILCLGILIAIFVDGFMTYQHLKLPVYTEWAI